MRLVLLVCVGVLCARPVAAQSTGQGNGSPPQLRLTEREAMDRFLANDPRMRALAAGIDEVRAAQAERAQPPNPSATWSRESVQRAHDTFLLVRQELPVSGRRGYLQEAGRLAVDAAEATARLERSELVAEVRQAYTALVVAQQRQAALEESIDGLQRLIDVLRAREEAGEGSTYDRMRGQRALVDLEAERALAASERTRAQGRLASYLGPGAVPESLVAADALALPDALPSPAPLIEQALANRGDYRAAQTSIERFEAERVAASRLRVPTPPVAAGLKRSDLGGTTSSGYQVTVDVAVPVFNRGQAAAALAIAQRTRAQAEAESRRLRIEAEVRTAHRLLEVHRERASRYQESAAAVAEPLANVGRVGYEEGELSILELLDAERQALDARLQVLELVAAARRAAIELDRIVGQELRP